MGTLEPGPTAHHTPTLGRPAALLVLGLALCFACSGRADRTRRPRDPSDRPTGCIDTPHIGGDHRATTTGIRCGGHSRAAQTVLLHGRVTMLVDGLPGPGVEAMWVGVHPFSSGQLDALPPARAETKTGPQGEFRLWFVGSGEYVVTVRAEASGPVLAARRVTADAGERSEPLNLQIPGSQ
jgi:hypothetical protein